MEEANKKLDGSSVGDSAKKTVSKIEGGEITVDSHVNPEDKIFPAHRKLGFHICDKHEGED